ncbi:retrovirus-related Pol polyprotein from transposon 297 [Trichonephila clavipes]|nr:retrovirus-related Pol polyprotein from transposon 297 [Trichonephila clavipes]
MLQLAEELGINATLNMTVPSIKIAITNSEGYEEEFVKNLYETIIANGKRLEEFKIESGFRVNDESNDSTNACSVTSNLNFKKLIPDFDPQQSDISLYLVIFERQAKRASIEKKEWVGQLLGLLPLEIVQFIAREPEEQAENYDYVKKLLLKRFKLSPEVFRQKFVQHQKKSDSTWKDFTFEITNYLDEWLIGLEINTFQDLKDLMVVDQLKKRANASMKDHFLDNWANLKSATQIAELFDNYEDVRKFVYLCRSWKFPEILERCKTKAAVCGNHINQHGRYLLGNKTAELIKGNLGYNFLPVEILNAVQTRSQVKAAREERGIDSGDAKKGEDEVIIVSSDAEDEILIPALQEYVPELALLRVTRENLINAQKNSEEIKPLYEQAASQVQVTNQVYSLEKELLVKNREDKLGNVVKLIVVPEELRDPIKSLCHEGTSAHLGITKSKDKLNRYFYWPNCYRDMEQFVKTCDQCQRAGKPNDKKKAPLKLVPVIQEVFTKLNIDACGPLPITSKGNRYLITAICMSSKFPEAIPVSDISSVSVTDALLNIFSRMGFPVKYNVTRVAGKEPRPCIDYRKLNGIIRTEYFPLPNIEERVEKVSAAKFITVLDLSKGYWQIPLSKTAQRYAAFCTSFGTYRPLRMSFGLKNAPYFFSKLMAELLNGLEDFVVPYLDDIPIFSDTWESHIKHMETVLQRIKRAKLTIRPSKCKFAQQNVKFLGHIVGQGSRTPSEIKVQAVLEFPTPRTKTQIRAFLGIAGYHQKYINLFSVIAAPLTDALKGRAKKEKLSGRPRVKTHFENLKGN